MIMTNWLAQALGLPVKFLNSKSGCGIGIIQSSASDATYIAILAARGRAVEVSIASHCHFSFQFILKCIFSVLFFLVESKIYTIC